MMNVIFRLLNFFCSIYTEKSVEFVTNCTSFLFSTKFLVTNYTKYHLNVAIYDVTIYPGIILLLVISQKAVLFCTKYRFTKNYIIA